MNRGLHALSFSAAILSCAFFVSTTFGGAAPAGAGGAARGAGRGAAGARGGGAPVGPPAPVPPEVAMPRPAADEVARINADLKQFVETNTSPDKDLLKKYEGLLTVQLPRANSAIAPTGGGVRAPRHDAFVNTAKSGDYDILFEGDSITDWWSQAAPNGGADVQKKYFGDVKVANFAVAGDTTQGVLWGLQNGEGQGHKPKAIMLMIGTNNIGRNTAPEIAEGIGAIVLEDRKDFPDARILLLAVFPRGTATDPNRAIIADINKIIAKLDDGKNVFFMDLGPKFLDNQGMLVGFRPDNLHPTEKGYETWGAAVAEKLKGLAK